MPASLAEPSQSPWASLLMAPPSYPSSQQQTGQSQVSSAQQFAYLSLVPQL